MLSETDAIPMIAVKDLEVAKQFYSETLGLNQTGSVADQVAVFQTGKTPFNLYRSQYAGTDKATVLAWSVGTGLEKLVKDLNAKGLKFEHYDMPGMTREGDIHYAGGMKSAWFKDPDGNILSVMS